MEWDQTPYTNNSFGLLPGARTEVTLGTFNFTTGSYVIENSVNALGDIDNSNNNYTANIFVNSFVESFEGIIFPPEGWTMGFGVRDDSNFGQAADGEYFISNLVDDNFFGVVNDTVFTPVLNIKQGDTFGFYIQSSLASPINATLVWKNEETGVITNISEIDPSEGFNNWEYREFDISAAEGANRIGVISLPNGSYGSSRFDFFNSSAQIYQYEDDARLLNGCIKLYGTCKRT